MTRYIHPRRIQPRKLTSRGQGRLAKPKIAAAPPVSKRTQAAISHALENARSPATSKAFQRTQDDFRAFCIERKYLEQHHLPVKEEVLCAFALSFQGRVAGATVRGKISNLKKWHEFEGAVWHGGLKLRTVLDFVEKCTPATSRKDLRKEITTDMLQLLINELDLAVGQDAAVFAVALTAFYGQLRLGEILSTHQDRTHKRANAIPAVKHLTPPSSARTTATLLLPSTKTSQCRGDTIILPKQSGPLDPLAALQYHIRRNRLSPECSLASYRSTSSTSVSTLTVKLFMGRCNQIWGQYGYAKYTGHSFRIGGTTHYLIARVDPQVVKAMGRWKSDAFQKYWRSLDALAALHTEHLRRK